MDRQLQVLILEDNPADAELVQRELRKAGIALIAQLAGDKPTYLKALEASAPELILADYSLPGFDGLTALALARQRFPEVPVIIVSGAIGEETAIEALKAGATDYVLKQRLSRLGPVVKRALLEVEQSRERRRAEHALRESEERLRVTLTSIGDAVIASDDQGRVSFLNPVAADLVGWPPAEALGRPIANVFRVINGQTRAPADDIVARVLRERSIVILANNTALVTRDGREIPIEDSAAPIFDAAGNVTGVVLVFRDVTQKRRAQQALLLEKSFTDTIIGALPGIFYLFDEQGRFLRWNEHFERVSGYSAAEMSTLHPLDLFRGDDKQLIAERIHEVFTKGETTAEAGIVSKSGTVVPYFFTGSRMVFDQMPCVVGVGVDITDRKRREERIAKLTRLYAVLSHVNEAIVRAHGAEPLYSDICRIIADEGGFPLVWIGLASRGRVLPQAWSGTAAEYLKGVKVAVRGKLGAGPTGTCIRENHAVVNDDFTVNSATAVWREAALRHGFRASAAFPLRRGGKAVGAITLYSCDPKTFDDEQVGLLEALSGDLSYALDAMDQEQVRRRAERDLAAVHQRLQALMDAVPVGVSFSDDATCQRITGNPAVLAQFEVRAEDNLSASASDPNAPGRQVRFYQQGRQINDSELPLQRAVAENREIPPMELDVELPSGRRWHASASGAPIRDSRGNVISGVAVTVDLTEHKRAEERARLLSDVTGQLLASDRPQEIVESLCRRVMEHLGCQVFFNYLVDEEAGVLRLNACAGIPGETARRIETLDIGTTVCGCAARDACRVVAEHIQTTPDPRTDLVSSFGVQAYACHPLMERGQVIGTLSFGSRVKPAFAEDELALMKAVADHVAIAMQRIRLLESLERHARAAEAANQAKGQFLANMSHELRTPMNAILGMIDVALPKAVDPTIQDCLRTAKGSADLLLTLLNDLLDSAKIESGKLELESAPFSLRRMLDQMTRVLAVRASEKGLAFSCRMPEDTPDAVVGDRMRLQQVLLNLAGNAIKFTEHGEVVVAVDGKGLGIRDWGLEERRQPTEAGQESLIPNPQSLIPSAVLHFTISDTGIGIPQSELGRLFEPFAQADASMARRFGGTGLGLSICKSLADLMGGRIWAESEPGKGSRFHFVVQLPSAKALPAEIEAPAIIPTAARKLRILLVEDNPANQKLAAYILQDRGHAVEIAGNGQEAIALAAQNRYDAILMDVQMPGMDGLEATAAIRSAEGLGIRDWGLEAKNPLTDADQDSLIPNPQSLIPASSRVPIIAMTAHAMKGDRERCLAAGMDSYLSKPINGREMIALVESLAEERGEEGRGSRVEGRETRDEGRGTKGEGRTGKGEGRRGRDEGLELQASPLVPSPASRALRPSTLDPRPSSPVFDPHDALKRCFDNPKMLVDMIQCFFDETDDLLAKMRAALKRDDLMEVGCLGHRLKGTIVYLGAEPARAAALAVERFERHGGDPAEAEQAIAALERQCEVLKAALREHRGLRLET